MDRGWGRPWQSLLEGGRGPVRSQNCPLVVGGVYETSKTENEENGRGAIEGLNLCSDWMNEMKWEAGGERRGRTREKGTNEPGPGSSLDYSKPPIVCT